MFGLICWVWRHVPEKDILGQQGVHTDLSKNKTNNPSIMKIILLVLVRVVDTVCKYCTIFLFSELNFIFGSSSAER